MCTSSLSPLPSAAASQNVPRVHRAYTHACICIARTHTCITCIQGLSLDSTNATSDDLRRSQTRPQTTSDNPRRDLRQPSSDNPRRDLRQPPIIPYATSDTSSDDRGRERARRRRGRWSMPIGLTRAQGPMASVPRTRAVVRQVEGRGDAGGGHLEERPDLKRVALEGVPCARALDLPSVRVVIIRPRVPARAHAQCP